MEEFEKLLKSYAGHKTLVIKNHESRNKAALRTGLQFVFLFTDGYLTELCKKTVVKYK
jgi:hypothetical protein